MGASTGVAASSGPGKVCVAALTNRDNHAHNPVARRDRLACSVGPVKSNPADLLRPRTVRLEMLGVDWRADDRGGAPMLLTCWFSGPLAL